MSGVFEVRRNFSVVYLSLYALLLIEILVRVCYCSEKIDPNFPLSALLLHKKNSSKMIKTLQSLVSLLFVAVPGGAMKLE